MAIQRAAPMPLPGDELAAIRARLAPEYGAELWDGDERRVLVIRVPRDQPDPVNDVEAAAEHLDARLVDEATHAIMVGETSAAQVYASPLRDLVRERVAMDRRLAAAWRQQLPDRLAHATFQSPEDPRRRWRLAVRLPCASIKEMDEEMLEDLAEGIGPELDTPRFKSLAAVYLIAAEDDVRLEARTFLPEMRQKWLDEERRRRAEQERLAQEAAEKARRAEEHEALLKDLERRVGRRPAAPPEVRHVHQRIDTLAARPATPRDRRQDGQAPGAAPDNAGATGLDAGARGDARADRPPAREMAERLLGRLQDARDELGVDEAGLLADHDATPAIRPAAKPQSIAHDADPAPRLASARDDSGPRGAAGTGDSDARPTTAATIPDVDALAARRKRRDPPIDDLRSRIDEVIAHEPRPPGHLSRPSPGRGADAATPSHQAGGTTSGRQPDVRTPRRAETIEEVLADAGFDMLRDPQTPGHVIDIAAERPEGDPQRLVVRKVERLDTAIAKELLKTARELDVDLVLCIAQHLEPEGERILVATKVQAMRPDDVQSLRL